MPENNAERPSFDPINTWERSQKEAVHSIRGESELVPHREVEAIYHYLDSGKKRELIETAAAEAFETLGIDSVLQMEKFPDEWERFYDIPIPEDGSPQVFGKPVGNGEVLIVMRANNGEPNTIFMFSTKPEGDGKINLDLSKNSGLMHVCTEETLDDANTWRTNLAHSLEGKWMRGDITSDEYKKRFAEKQSKSLTDFHKEFDAMRREDKDTQFKTYTAGHNLEVFKGNAPGDGESMWTEEDARWERRQKKIDRAYEIAGNILADIKNDMLKFKTLGANIAEAIKIGWTRFRERQDD